MDRQIEHARAFHALHRKGDPVVLYNIWDPGSAQIVAGAGAKALATGSWPVATAFGFPDGEKIPLHMALENFSRIVAAVDLPVTMDLEGGYGVQPEAVADTVTRAMEAGAVGFNFEDQVVGGEGLHDLALQVRRIEAAVAAVEATGVPAFVNARTDIFLQAEAGAHDAGLLDQALERAAAFEKAGASGFFAPGLADEGLIGKLVKGTALPVNILMRPNVPPRAKLAALGVARISYGGSAYRAVAEKFAELARAAISG